MKVLCECILPDGSLVRVEDWSEDYSCCPYGSMIGAYPRKYGRVRAEAQFENHTQTLEAFEKLSQGKVTIFDVNFTVMRCGGYRVPITEVIDRNKGVLI